MQIYIISYPFMSHAIQSIGKQFQWRAKGKQLKIKVNAQKKYLFI